MKSAFTLIELLVAIIIIGILSAVAIPSYTKMREAQYDKDAQANLKLIMAAEKIYRMEAGIYYPFTGTAAAAALNSALRLSLITASNPNRLWDYTAKPDHSDMAKQKCCLEAVRTATGGGDTTKKWVLKQDTPNNLPISGSCP